MYSEENCWIALYIKQFFGLFQSGTITITKKQQKSQLQSCVHKQILYHFNSRYLESFVGTSSRGKGNFIWMLHVTCIHSITIPKSTGNTFQFHNWNM